MNDIYVFWTFFFVVIMREKRKENKEKLRIEGRLLLEKDSILNTVLHRTAVIHTSFFIMNSSMSINVCQREIK